jgi:hypothetical protein
MTTSEHVSTVVGLANVPPEIRVLDTFASPDYVDLYTARTSRAGEKSPEEWARAIIEESPIGRHSARRLWRALGLRLAPPDTPGYVQGWKIAAAGDDWIRIETGSWYMSGHAVCRVEEDAVSIALFLRYDRPIAALVWALVGIGHRRAVPVMFHQALSAGRARAEVA